MRLSLSVFETFIGTLDGYLGDHTITYSPVPMRPEKRNLPKKNFVGYISRNHFELKPNGRNTYDGRLTLINIQGIGEHHIQISLWNQPSGKDAEVREEYVAEILLDGNVVTPYDSTLTAVLSSLEYMLKNESEEVKSWRRA